MSNPLGAEAVALANLDPAYASHTEPDRRRPGNAFEHAAAEVLNWRSENIVAAGAELGLWMCLAFGLEVLGVQVRQWAVGTAWGRGQDLDVLTCLRSECAWRLG